MHYKRQSRWHLREPERDLINLSDPVATWPVLDVLVSSLVGKYSDLLDIDVDGQPADYLLWETVDVGATFPATAEPDWEHLAIAVRVLEGVLTEAPSQALVRRLRWSLRRLAG